ncbi:MAG TPA: YebC/PmpR family DNA-binding transcriptional regulator [Candidatus Saccharimonadia bacterium]|nr:YebC/PmpR family DNA-binding transcriptional regulator [Candidatus Saccharimonadia bacterium]
MSGHSKWNNIKNKKAATDARKGKAFTLASKNITIAVRKGGSGNPNDNPSLRLAMEKAREVDMPNDNVQRAINRGLGKGESGNLEEIVYEGYGPHGIGFLVVVHTDNKQRTGAEVRLLFDRAGGSLGSPGSVMYLFQKSGTEYILQIPLEITDPAQQEEIQEFFDEVEAHDDVEAVYMNAVFPGGGAVIQAE